MDRAMRDGAEKAIEEGVIVCGTGLGPPPRVTLDEALAMMTEFVPGYANILTVRKSRRAGKRYVIGARNPDAPTDVVTLGAGRDPEEAVQRSIERCLLDSSLLTLFGLNAKAKTDLLRGAVS